MDNKTLQFSLGNWCVSKSDDKKYVVENSGSIALKIVYILTPASGRMGLMEVRQVHVGLASSPMAKK